MTAVGLIETHDITIDKKTATGLKVNLQGAPLLLISAPNGYLMCGYLNLETAERLGQVAVIVTSVKSFDDALNAKVAKATTKARALGINEGIVGREALKRMLREPVGP